jgi:hypothetical protein
MEQIIKKVLDSFESKEIVVEGDFTVRPHCDIIHNDREYTKFKEKLFTQLCEEIKQFVFVEQIESQFDTKFNVKMKLIVSRPVSVAKE